MSIDKGDVYAVIAISLQLWAMYRKQLKAGGERIKRFFKRKREKD